MTVGVGVLVVALVIGATVGVVTLRRNGRFRRHDSRRPAGDPPNVEHLTPAELGAELGERATLVQFSSAFCAPCRATRVMLRDIAAKRPGVSYVDIDAESHLDLVRRLRVMRTPTVFILDRRGKVLARASGRPDRASVLAVLDGAETSPVG
ncbi:MAG TPA: thioredoxin family protein [Actinopolymorphaceae bacterium]